MQLTQRILKWPTLFALLLVVTKVASGQYSHDGRTISGGSGTATGGVYVVRGTIGQPVASGPVTGGNISIAGGFWPLFIVPTTGAPLLSILLTPTNTAVISWPSPSAGFTLQQRSDLNTANWDVPPEAVNDDGVRRFIIVNPPSGNRYFRLVKE